MSIGHILGPYFCHPDSRYNALHDEVIGLMPTAARWADTFIIGDTSRWERSSTRLVPLIRAAQAAGMTVVYMPRFMPTWQSWLIPNKGETKAARIRRLRRLKAKHWLFDTGWWCNTLRGSSETAAGYGCSSALYGERHPNGFQNRWTTGDTEAAADAIGIAIRLHGAPRLAYAYDWKPRTSHPCNYATAFANRVLDSRWRNRDDWIQAYGGPRTMGEIKELCICHEFSDIVFYSKSWTPVRVGEWETSFAGLLPPGGSICYHGPRRDYPAMIRRIAEVG